MNRGAPRSRASCTRPRYGPPRPPTLGRAPAEPWRASGLTRDGSSNQPLALELVAGLRDVVVGPLLPRPRHEVLDALGEPHARAEAERAADARDVGHAVANVAFAEPADDLRRQRHAHRPRDRLRERGHRGRAPGAYVERHVDDVRALQRQAEGLDDVAHVDEVAALAAVLEHERPLAVEQARREDRADACVRVGERLAGAVHVEEPEGDGADAVRAADAEAEMLLATLGHRVHRRWRDRLVLVARRRRGGGPAR